MKWWIVTGLGAVAALVWALWPEPPAPADPTDTLAQLGSLGYVSWVEADDGAAGARALAPAADRGPILFTSRPRASAHLIDRRGARLHAWQNPVGRAAWNHVELLPDGDLLAMQRYLALTRLDRHSQIVWRRELGAHHDVARLDDGRLLVLDADWRRVPGVGPILDNGVTELGSDGEVRRTHWLSEVFADPAGPLAAPLRYHLLQRRRETEEAAAKDPKLALALSRLAPSAQRTKQRLALVDRPPDVLHVNALDVLPARPGLWPAGAVLLSIREMDTIAVVSLAERRVHWAWGPDADPPISRQHHATYLANGNILLLDNGRRRRRWTRVLELDPESRAVVWRYEDRANFYTGYRGAAQRLPNGNTLVCESDEGRAFEVTPDGAVVWEYYNRDFRSRDGERQRAALYRVERVEPPPWLSTETPTISAGTGTSK